MVNDCRSDVSPVNDSDSDKQFWAKLQVANTNDIRTS